MTASDEVSVVNRYALRADTGAFTAAATALAQRVEAEGHPGLRSYRFFCLAPGNEARLLAVYHDPAAWVGHHDLAMGWPEMAELRAVADLIEIAIHGPISAGMQDWLDRAGMTSRLRHHGMAVAGFRRSPG